MFDNFDKPISPGCYRSETEKNDQEKSEAYQKSSGRPTGLTYSTRGYHDWGCSNDKGFKNVK